MTINKQFNGRIFVTSDTHLGHAAAIQYCPGRGATVEEMNELLIER